MANNKTGERFEYNKRNRIAFGFEFATREYIPSTAKEKKNRAKELCAVFTWHVYKLCAHSFVLPSVCFQSYFAAMNKPRFCLNSSKMHLARLLWVFHLFFAASNFVLQNCVRLFSFWFFLFGFWSEWKWHAFILVVDMVKWHSTLKTYAKHVRMKRILCAKDCSENQIAALRSTQQFLKPISNDTKFCYFSP